MSPQRATVGQSGLINAIGPCFISPAGYPLALMYEISFNLRAPSKAPGPIIAIVEEGSQGIKEVADEIIWVPKSWDEFSVIPATVAAQLFAYYVANERGAEIDQPRNLAKSVTVE